MQQLGFRTQKRIFLLSLYSLLAIAAFTKLVSRESFEPLIFGQYSLPYFLFLIFVATGILLLGLGIYRFGAGIFYLLAGNMIALISFAIPIEVAGQIYAYRHPAYDVLAWQPDRVVGWKLVPNLQWVWTGYYWYARDFSVPVKTNSLGFRDLEREFQKSPDKIRIALIGDSFVEALQVPFEKTAGHLLEEKLNSLTAKRHLEKPARYEVLNFGISSFGVGQYLLTFEQYALKFRPNYVFLFAGQKHMERTVKRYEEGHFEATKGRQLWVRPTFRLEGGALVHEAAENFDEFARIQQKLMETEFQGARITRRKPGLFIAPWFQNVWRIGETYLMNPLMEFQRKVLNQNKSSEGTPRGPISDLDGQIVALNLKIIEELGRKVNEIGGRVIIVSDVSRNSEYGSEILSTTVEEFCREKGLGYIPLGDYLYEAKKRGINWRWAHDAHFNEKGNEIFADSMYHWLIDHVEI